MVKYYMIFNVGVAWRQKTKTGKETNNAKP